VDKKKCKHEQFVVVYPKTCYIHRKIMPKGITVNIESISIKICFDCGKILNVVDYHE